MRAIAYLAIVTMLASGLYIGAIAPALRAIDSISSAIATRDTQAGICFQANGARLFGISPNANAIQCAKR